MWFNINLNRRDEKTKENPLPPKKNPATNYSFRMLALSGESEMEKVSVI